MDLSPKTASLKWTPNTAAVHCSLAEKLAFDQQPSRFEQLNPFGAPAADASMPAILQRAPEQGWGLMVLLLAVLSWMVVGLAVTGIASAF